VRDITERKRHEDALLAANRKLNLLNSITRHDINNQLAIASGFLMLLQRQDPALPVERVIENLQATTAKIHRIIHFTKEYQEVGVQSPSWQNLAEIVERAARIIIEGPGIAAHIDPQCRNIEIFGDAMLAKVFYNLIDNSIRHGGNMHTISLTFYRNLGKGVIVYEDDGTGISDEARQTLFEPGKGKNTGFGLFLIREILGITGFTIKETGKFGSGARFEIVVPEGYFREL